MSISHYDDNGLGWSPEEKAAFEQFAWSFQNGVFTTALDWVQKRYGSVPDPAYGATDYAGLDKNDYYTSNWVEDRWRNNGDLEGLTMGLTRAIGGPLASAGACVFTGLLCPVTLYTAARSAAGGLLQTGVELWKFTQPNPTWVPWCEDYDTCYGGVMNWDVTT